MAVPPAVPGVIRVDLHYTIGEDTNVHSHFYMSCSASNIGVGTLNSLAALVSTAWGNNLKEDTGPGCQFTGCTVTDLSSPGSQQGTATSAVFGTSGTGQLTAETAVVMNFHVNRRWRGGHYRAYLPPLGASNLSDAQTWAAGSVSQMNTDWHNFISQIQGFTGPPTFGSQVGIGWFLPGEWQLVGGKPKWIASYRTNPIVDTVTSATMNPKPGSQRRRMVR